MMRAIALVWTAILFAGTASAGNLTVTITGVDAKGGTLRVAAYDQKGFAPGSAPLTHRLVPASAGTMTVVLDDVPPGEICVKVLQDLNGNGKMDFNFGFIPAEPYGFSNNPEIKMGPPSWNDVKFTMKTGDGAITIAMK